MTKNQLMALIVEGLKDYIPVNPTLAPRKNEKNKMKKTELRSLVNEVVRQCVNEVGPQYKVRGKKSQLEQPGIRNKSREIQSDPEINEVAPPGGEDVVKALKKKSGVDNPWAVAWSMKNKGQLQQEDNGSEETNILDVPGEHSYDEQEEIEILKQIAQLLLKLLYMHKEFEVSDSETESEPSSFSPEESGEKDTAEDSKEDELDESNHKVQSRSYKTVKDVSQNPKNIRDPKVPMS